jgi:hypothetical protein
VLALLVHSVVPGAVLGCVVPGSVILGGVVARGVLARGVCLVAPFDEAQADIITKAAAVANTLVGANAAGLL